MSDEQILALAVELWRQSPGAEFTMDRLAEVSGLSRASLYRRFGSREAILQRLADEHAIDMQELARPDIPTRILKATGVVLGRYGFVSMTVEQIAQEAGVGPATIYRHFGSKEELIEAFLRVNSPRQLLRELVADEESDLEADLTLVAATMLQFIDENRGIVRVFVFENQGVRGATEKIRASQGRTLNVLAEYFAGHIALGTLQAADPFSLALSFVGMLIGVGLVGPHSYERPLIDATADAKFVTQIFLRGAVQPHFQKLEKSS
jgi:AcrR family transcriptional regulator